jgi:peptidoglycan hydrolase CwlO-like protein
VSPARVAAAIALVAVLAGLPAIALHAAPGGSGSDVVEGARAQVRELEAELVRLGDDAGAAAAAHAQARERADGLRARIRETTASLREAREAHDAAVDRLSERLVSIYVQEPPTLVEVVLASGDLSDVVDTQATLEAIGDRDARLVASLERTRGRLARVRAELVGRRAEADAAVEEAAGRLARMEGLLRSRRAVLAQAVSALDAMVVQEGRRERPAARRERAAAIEAGGRRVEESVRRGARPGPAPAPAAPEPVAAIPGAPGPGVLERIAQCESGGNPRAVSASGQYRGKYQFSQATWEGVGGTGDPAAASEAEQDKRAAILYAQSGPAPWPVCGYR